MAASGVADVGDLFLGSCGIEKACAAAGAPVTLGAEICPAIIACYRAVAAGWEPPARLSYEDYYAAKKLYTPESTDPMAAFALAFCAYGGKWGGGRLPDDKRYGDDQPTCAYAAALARQNLLRMAPMFRAMRLECMDYREAAKLVPDGGVLYLDPPWRGTLPYAQAPAFDVDAFWAWAAEASLRWRVIVSEGLAGPPACDGTNPWALAWTRRVPSPGLVANKIECLWYLRGGLAGRVLTEVL